MRALIFANGEPNNGPMVQRAIMEAGENAMVIAADGGARIARYYSQTIDMVIGDMDSLLPAEINQLEAEGVNISRYPSEKNETDLELALKWTIQQGADWIRIIGGVGGRFDQMIANVYLLALPELKSIDVMLAANNQLIGLLYPGEHKIEGQTGDTISLIPVSTAVENIQTDNLVYPLRHETLEFGPARGISNIMQEETATVYFDSGLLMLVHTVGRA